MTPHRPALTSPDGYEGPRRALILAGGGMRVAYQSGVLEALGNAGVTFEHFDGTSGGVINLAMLCSGLSPREMSDRWRTLNVRDFASPMPLHQYLMAHDMAGMADADGIVDKVFPHLGIDVERIRSAEGMSATFNVCNYTRKTNEAIPHNEVDLDLIVAGITLPVFMPAIKRGDTTYVDSVWIKDANLMEAVRRGAEELWLVWCIGNQSTYEDGFFHQFVHMIEMSANGALFEEFERIREINERIEGGEVVYGHRRPIKLHLIKPEFPLPLDPEFFFGRISAATLIDMGHADASHYLETIDPAGVPFQPEATKMNDATLGLSFSETMAGGFALGETDPVAGKGAGRAAGTELAMHATVTIRDIRRFVEDPEHAGELVGHIDFTPFGESIPASTGAFNLFHPTGDPDLKLMVYELGFNHDGQDYYLAGKKEVRDDPGLDLWKDTTTLFTRLHEGRDSTGPVVGAGVLRLGVKELAKLVTTIRALGASSVLERAEAVAHFGRFFMGELWDRYAGLAAKGDDNVDD